MKYCDEQALLGKLCWLFKDPILAGAFVRHVPEAGAVFLWAKERGVFFEKLSRFASEGTEHQPGTGFDELQLRERLRSWCEFNKIILRPLPVIRWLNESFDLPKSNRYWKGLRLKEPNEFMGLSFENPGFPKETVQPSQSSELTEHEIIFLCKIAWHASKSRLILSTTSITEEPKALRDVLQHEESVNGITKLTYGKFKCIGDLLVLYRIIMCNESAGSAILEIRKAGYEPSWTNQKDVLKSIAKSKLSNRKSRFVGNLLVLIEVLWYELPIVDAINKVRKRGIRTSSKNYIYKWLHPLRGPSQKGLQLKPIGE